MLAPIPRRILTDSVEFYVPTGTDQYGKPITTTYSVSKCHLQNTNETRKAADNTEVVLRSVLFVDARLSDPVYDYVAFQESAHAAGSVMTCKVTDRRGNVTGPYTILVVDAVPDDAGNLHHTELGLV